MVHVVSGPRNLKYALKMWYFSLSSAFFSVKVTVFTIEIIVKNSTYYQLHDPWLKTYKLTL